MSNELKAKINDLYDSVEACCDESYARGQKAGYEDGINAMIKIAEDFRNDGIIDDQVFVKLVRASKGLESSKVQAESKSITFIDRVLKEIK